MPYIVFTGGDEGFREAENLDHAMDISAWALRQADDFARRMGWAPFWVDQVDIRRITEDAMREHWRDADSVVEHSRQTHDAAAIRKCLGMPPCPADRPSYA